jgi:hypothetical protein
MNRKITQLEHALHQFAQIQRNWRIFEGSVERLQSVVDEAANESPDGVGDGSISPQDWELLNDLVLKMSAAQEALRKAQEALPLPKTEPNLADLQPGRMAFANEPPSIDVLRIAYLQAVDTYNLARTREQTDLGWSLDYRKQHAVLVSETSSARGQVEHAWTAYVEAGGA